jgi:hypothetical protein
MPASGSCLDDPANRMCKGPLQMAKQNYTLGPRLGKERFPALLFATICLAEAVTRDAYFSASKLESRQS